MSNRSLLVTLAVCGAALSAVQPANADALPGAPAPGAASNGRMHVWENIGLPSEIKNQTVANLVCDGYVTMGEPPAEGSGTSDIVVFHNATGLPSGACDSTCVTVLSDPHVDTNGVDPPDGSSVLPSGCLFQVTNPDGTCSPTLLPGYVQCPLPPAPQCAAGQACVPANLMNLTAAMVAAGAGTPGSGAFNATQALTEQGLFRTHNVGLSYDALASAGASNHYTIVSDVPALPPWAFALLGCVLAGSAVVVLRRRGGMMTPSA